VGGAAPTALSGLAFALLALLLLLITPTLAQEEIRSFATAVTLMPSGAVDVTEDKLRALVIGVRREAEIAGKVDRAFN